MISPTYEFRKQEKKIVFINLPNESDFRYIFDLSFKLIFIATSWSKENNNNNFFEDN